MTTTARGLGPYSDDRGNVVEVVGSDGTGPDVPLRVHFRGRRNRVVVHTPVRLGDVVVHFDCDDGYVELGSSRGVPALHANLRVGQDARVVLGRDVSSTARVGMSAVEGATITVGDDVMFASENQLRCDDGHPIFDVRTGLRVNPARSITVGDHVWVGWGAVLLGGAEVGEGAVVGLRSVVTGRVPNNSIAVGVPARVVRRDVAWERPHLSLVEPFYKPDASTVERSPYWRLTQDGDAGPVPGPVRRRRPWWRRRWGRRRWGRRPWRRRPAR